MPAAPSAGFSAAAPERESASSALARAWLEASRPVQNEVDAELEVLEGALPEELRGTLYRNGPGRFEVGGERYKHPFDGDGMVTRFAFDGRRVAYANRFVRTREFVEEERQGRMLFRGFGTNLPGGLRRNFLRLRFKNAANTSVVLHAGRLLALWEGGLPHELDPETLGTRSRFDFGGRLRNDFSRFEGWLSPELPFSAHPKVDPKTGELWNFGTLLGRRNRLLVYRVGSDGALLERRVVPMGRLSFVHDFALTERHAVFFLAPVSFDVLRTLSGLSTPAGSIREEPGAPTQVLVVPRAGGEARRFEVEHCFVFHFANAYEKDGTIVVDAFRTPRFPEPGTFEGLLEGRVLEAPPDGAGPLLTRYRLDLASGRTREEAITDHPGELPTIDGRRVGRRHRSVYSVGARPGRASLLLTGILRTDVEARRAVLRDFAPDLPGEPVFAPGGEGDAEGWLLVLAHGAASGRAELHVLRADDLSTACRLGLPHHLPPGFHGTWVPAR